MPKLHYLLPPEEVVSAYGVTVRINPDGTVDVSGAKQMRFEAEDMDFKAQNINMEAEQHMVLKSKRIDLNPSDDPIQPDPSVLFRKRTFD
jgi:hypothetical protein